MNKIFLILLTLILYFGTKSSTVDGTYKTALLKYGGWMCDRWEHRSNEAREYLNKVLGNDLK